MTKFDFSHFFGNNNFASKKRAKKQRQGRTCRIEELEGREMLSVTPWSLVNDYLHDDEMSGEHTPTDEYQMYVEGLTSPALAQNTPALAPLAAAPGNAQARDLAVYNNLISRGCRDNDFWWNDEGQITDITTSRRGVTGTLDVSGLTALEQLICNGNQLTTLNVSGCTALTTLECESAKLSTLNVSSCTALQFLYCSSNQLTMLNVSGLTNLREVWCNNNQMTALNVSGCTALGNLRCNNNKLSTLNASGCTVLTNLECDNNQLKTLNVSTNLALGSLWCGGNGMTTLITNESHSFSGTGITSGNPGLQILKRNAADVAVVIREGLPEEVLGWTTYGRLVSIDAENAGLAGTLNLSGLTALGSLYCNGNQLEVLNVSGTNLAFLVCQGNQLRTLDVSGMTNLREICCWDNQLETLNVSGCTALKSLQCYSNQLETLNVSGCTALESLQCLSNQLGTLDVSSCKNLSSLACNRNQLETLDVSGLTNLRSLWCDNNQLTELDVDGCTTLGYVRCHSNQLETLDVSSCTALTTLECDSNKLNVLVVSGLTNLETLSCIGNQLTELNLFGSSLADFSSATRTVRSWAEGSYYQYAYPSGAKLYVDTTVMLHNGSMTTSDQVWLDAFLAAHPSLSESIAKWTGERITELEVNDKGLTGTLNVSALTALVRLDCGENQLEALDVSGLTSLQSLRCNDNQLEALDVSGCTALTNLFCGGNQLETLDMTDCIALVALFCDDNRLAGRLDMSGFPNIKSLRFGGNPLTELIVSGLTKLVELHCQRTLLTELNLFGTPFANATLDTQEDYGVFWRYTYTYSSDDPLEGVLRLWVNKDVVVLNEGVTISDDQVWLNNFLAANPGLSTSIATWTDGRITKIDVEKLGLTGTLDVSALSALEDLYCTGNQLEALDVSGCTDLLGLFCNNNQLNSLDLSHCTKLEYLSCCGNQLETLDVSNLTDMRWLYCYDTQLETLDVSGCTKLETLHCFGNMLKDLDVSGCTALTRLNCTYNNMDTLYINKSQSFTLADTSISTGNPNLEIVTEDFDVYDAGDVAILKREGLIMASGAKRKGVEFTWNAEGRLTELFASEIGLTGSLSLAGLTALEYLECRENQLTALDVSGCTALEYLDCWGNQLETLTFSDCTNLVALNCGMNQLETLDVSDCTNLEVLDCGGNLLGSLDVSSCTKLETLACNDNQLVTLDVSSCTKLETLACSDNQLVTLDVFSCTNLRQLYCGDNLLGNLNVSRCTNLLMLSCSNNNMNTLYVNKLQSFSLTDHSIADGNPGLTIQIEDFNDYHAGDVAILKREGLLLGDGTEPDDVRLTWNAEKRLIAIYAESASLDGTLDLTGLTELEYLNCFDNALEALIISELTNLKQLYCYGNELETLVVSGCTNLEFLSCANNRLETLDVSSCTNLEILDCYENLLTELDVSHCTNLLELYCGGNQLETLNVSGCAKLKLLDCSTNQLEILDVSSCSALQYLNCVDNGMLTLYINTSQSFSLTDSNISDGNPDLTIETKDSVSYHAGDVEILQREGLLLADGVTERTGVSLTWSVMGRLTGIEACNVGLTGTLDLTGLTALESLDCSENQLTALDVSESMTLAKLHCNSNLLKFSELPPVGSGIADYVYNPQSVISIVLTDSVVNLFSEFMIDGEETDFAWYCGGSELILGTHYTAEDGVFTFTGLNDGDIIHCEMTNARFPLLTLKTSQVTIVAVLPADKPVITKQPSSTTYTQGQTATPLSVTASGNGTLTYQWYCLDETLSVIKIAGETSATYTPPTTTIGACTYWCDVYNTSGSTMESETSDGATITVTSAVPEYNAEDVIALQREGMLLADGVTERAGVALTWNAMGRLTGIVARNVGLTDTLNLTGLTALSSLDCSDNQLTALDVSKNTALQTLWCHNNRLTTLDVLENMTLEFLSCSDNLMTALDVSKNTALKTLQCHENQLETLDVSENIALLSLSCYSNKLTKLDVSKNTSLAELYCGFNLLKFSELPPVGSGIADYDYAPQSDIPIVLTDSEVDIFSEFMIDGEETGYVWYLGDTELTLDIHFTANDGVFTFIGLNDGDIIHCEMTNVKFPLLTLKTSPITINIGTKEAGAPQSPENLTEDGKTSSSVSLKWDAVPGATYEIRYRVATDTKGNAISKQATLDKQVWVTQLVVYDSNIGVIIEGLKADTGYQFQVRAVNDDGKSDWSVAPAAGVGITKTSAIATNGDGVADIRTASVGKITVPKPVVVPLMPDTATMSWNSTVNKDKTLCTKVDSYVLTYSIPSGMKGVPATTVSLVISTKDIAENGTYYIGFDGSVTKSDIKLASYLHQLEVKNNPAAGTSKVPAGSQTFTLTLGGLKASASYKVSLVGMNVGGSSTKSVGATLKTQAVGAVKKVSVAKNALNKPNITVSSITLKVESGTVPVGYVVGGYIVQVYAPKLKGMSEPPLVQTLYFEAKDVAKMEVNKLQASTKYTFVVLATNKSGAEALMADGTIRSGQKLSAVKSVVATTAKYAAPSGFKFNATAPASLTFKVPANDKYPVGLTPPDNQGLGGGYNEYKIFVVVGTGANAKLELRGSVEDVSLTGNKFVDGRIDLIANKSLFAGLSGNLNFVIRAVFEDIDGHIVTSQDGKFKLTANQLNVINAP